MGGSVLVPTALQLELVVAAVPALHTAGGVGLALTNISVQAPVVLVEGTPHALRVEGVLPLHGASGRFSVRSPDQRTHLSLGAARIPGRAIGREVTPVRDRHELPGHANRVYPPLFHGPAFQVIERFGQRADGMVSTLATQLAP